jgi:hypothetical protein
MSNGLARRAFLQAMAAAFTTALLRPRFALGDDRNILDGGPWLANVEGHSLADAASVADAWGRRGLRVLVVLGPDLARDPEAWAAALELRGWRTGHRAHRYRGDALGVAACFLDHPEVQRGGITLLAVALEEFMSGGEAAVLDGCSPAKARDAVLRALHPWASHSWVGTLYRRWRPGRPFRLDVLHDRVERMLGFDPTRRAR